jgi:hypothetical protein
MTQEEIDPGMAAVESELRLLARELDIALDAIAWQWGSDDSWIVVVCSGTAKEQDRLTVRQLEDYENPGVAVQLRHQLRQLLFRLRP